MTAQNQNRELSEGKLAHKRRRRLVEYMIISALVVLTTHFSGIDISQNQDWFIAACALAALLIVVYDPVFKYRPRSLV